MSGGREGEPCKGNIFQETDPNMCENINVEFKWEVCNFFMPNGGFDDNSQDYLYEFNTRSADKTYAKFKNVPLSFDFSDLPVSELCRSLTRLDVINTCSETRTATSFKASRRLEGAGPPEQCGYYKFFSVKPTPPQLSCGFIITEIADPKR